MLFACSATTLYVIRCFSPKNHGICRGGKKEKDKRVLPSESVPLYQESISLSKSPYRQHASSRKSLEKLILYLFFWLKKRKGGVNSYWVGKRQQSLLHTKYLFGRNLLISQFR